MTESHEIGVEECEELLRAGVAGRVAVSTPTGPHIVPVNYSVVDGAIVIRTSPYSLLGTHGRNTTLAFEVDGFDVERQLGWSVQARGHAEEVADRDELDRLREDATQQPWAAGARVLVLRLRWSELTGRRLSDRGPRLSRR
jgi:nitroimidazol reductase NimA-like FMN-containing flavoprotein (pyridoxamine 5'-phosphate oxidase superfamily)